MNIIELLLTSISLSMDAFTVSICKGLNNKKNNLKNSIIIGLYFGIFQAIMPLLGFLLANNFKEKIINYDHYIALIMLSFIGYSMIKNRNENNEVNNNLKFREMITLSIATSIDAMVVGITLSFLNVNILLSVLVIGIVTFIITIVGYNLGNIVGKKLNNISQIIGGLTLIIMGIKIFIEHTFL